MTESEPKNNSGLWLSVAEVARRKGVSRQTIAERVAKFEDAGRLTTQPGPRGSKLVNLAEFDRAADEQTSFAHQDGARSKRPGSRRAAYNDALAEKVFYESELKRIELAERTGELMRVVDVQDAIAAASATIVAAVERIGNRFDDINAAAAAGPGALRVLLRTIVFDTRRDIAAALRSKMAEPHPTAPTVQDDLPLTTG